MRNKTIAALLLTPLPAMLIPAGGSGSQDRDPIKIGALYNLHGSQASLDIPSANGARLAVKELNSKGGLHGRRVELVLYDGRTDIETIKQVARKLVETDRVAAIIGFSDNDMVMAAAPIAAAAGTVFITSGATSPRLPGLIKDYLFLACFGDNVQAAAGAEYAYKRLCLKTAALLTDEQMDYTLLLSRYFKERFMELGGSILLDATYQGGDRDFSGFIRNMINLNSLPDLLYIASGPDDIGSIVKQLRQAGLTMPVMGGDAYDTPLLYETAGRDAEGVYFTTHALLQEKSGTERVRRFISAYNEEYGELPEDAFAALGYDAVNILADALGRSHPGNTGSLVAALLEIKGLPAVTGEISYADGSRIPHKSVTVVTIREGQPALAAVVLPEKVPAP